jgi:hypothetical protein
VCESSEVVEIGVADHNRVEMDFLASLDDWPVSVPKEIVMSLVGPSINQDSSIGRLDDCSVALTNIDEEYF